MIRCAVRKQETRVEDSERARHVSRPFMEHRNTIDATAFARSQASSILFYSLGDSSPL